MFGWFAKALAFFYDIWPSYGGSIILFTLAIMVLLLPLTLKGTRSMIAMQRLQPEIKKLQNRYKDDRQKLNEELLKFYRENKINPLGGCLPMLIQLPVFWVLYEVLLGLTRRAPFGFDLGGALGVGPANQFARLGFFDPKYLDHTSHLYNSLHSTNKMLWLGFDLSETVTSALRHGLVHALPFIILIVIVVVTTYVQQKQIQGRTPQSSVSQQQQMMMKFLPIVFAVIYIVIPAGVVLYFLVSNVFRIVQQAFITRTMYAEGGVLETTAVETGSSGGGVVGRLRESWSSLTGSGTAAPSSGKANKAKAIPAKTGNKRPAKAAAAKAGGGARSGGAAKRSGGGKPGTPTKSRRGAGNGSAKGTDRGEQQPRRAAKKAAPAGEGAGRKAATEATTSDGAAKAEGVSSSPSSRNGNGRAAPSRRAPQPPNRSRTKRKRR